MRNLFYFCFFGAFSWVPSVYKTNSRLRPLTVEYKRIKSVLPKENTRNGVVQKPLFPCGIRGGCLEASGRRVLLNVPGVLGTIT